VVPVFDLAVHFRYHAPTSVLSHSLASVALESGLILHSSALYADAYQCQILFVRPLSFSGDRLEFPHFGGHLNMSDNAPRGASWQNVKSLENVEYI
jgi:hypothetical protein